MSAELLFELGWKSFVVAGLTLLVLALTKRRSAGERSWIAHIGLVATLLLPLSVAAGPNWRVEALPAVAAPVAERATSEPMVVRHERGDAAPTAEAAARPAVARSRLETEHVVTAIYALPAGVMTALLLMALFRLQGLRRRADVLVEPQWLTALAMAQRRMGFKHATALLISEDLRSPISWGVLRPIILLDQRAAADTAQAEAIIAHELAHVARLDWAMLILGRLVTAVFWFNPLVWVLARRCHELSEQAVDDAVLRSDIRSTDYAQLLIGAARHNNRAVLLAANGVAGSGPLTHRVQRVLDTTHSRKAAQGSWIAGCCAAALLVVGPLSALSPARADAARSTPFSGEPVLAVPGDGEPKAGGDAAPSESPASSPPAGPNRGSGDGPVNPPAAVIAALTPAAMREALGAASEIEQRDVGEDLQALQALRTLEALPPAPAPPAPNTPPADTARGAAKSGGASGAKASGAGLRDTRPLIVAAWRGNLDMIKLLVEAGADVDAPVPGEGTPLTKAAAAGHLEVVKYLLDQGADVNRHVPANGTALLQASYHGHEALVRYLIARGADVNGRRGASETPLTAAVSGGHPNIVRILIAAGAGRES